MTYRLFFLCILLLSSMQANGSIEVPAGGTLSYEKDGKWKVFTLTAEPVNRVIYTEKENTLEPYVKAANRFYGKEMKLPVKEEVLEGWGYNGQIPGPAIIVDEGDFVRIIVHNKLPEATTVHWHSLILPNDMDGTGGTADPVIEPGKSATYEFQVNQVGTFMYHSGFNDTKQVQKGMGGFFISLPKEPKHPDEKDFAIMLQMFTLPPEKGEPTVFSMNPNWFTYNGVCAPNSPVLTVKEGDRVRIRLANLSTDSHPIHLHGYSYTIVGTEGGVIPESAQWPATTVDVSPGQTRDISFIASNPGLWRFHCHKILHIVNDNSYWQKQKELGILPIGGMFTFLYVEPKEKTP
jgi:manganese oxidase